MRCSFEVHVIHPVNLTIKIDRTKTPHLQAPKNKTTNFSEYAQHGPPLFQGISVLAKDVAGKLLSFQGPSGVSGVASVPSSGGVLLVGALPGVKLTNVRVVVRGGGESQIDLTGGGEC